MVGIETEEEIVSTWIKIPDGVYKYYYYSMPDSTRTTPALLTGYTHEKIAVSDITSGAGKTYLEEGRYIWIAYVLKRRNAGECRITAMIRETVPSSSIAPTSNVYEPLLMYAQRTAKGILSHDSVNIEYNTPMNNIWQLYLVYGYAYITHHRFTFKTSVTQTDWSNPLLYKMLKFGISNWLYKRFSIDSFVRFNDYTYDGRPMNASRMVKMRLSDVEKEGWLMEEGKTLTWSYTMSSNQAIGIHLWSYNWSELFEPQKSVRIVQELEYNVYWTPTIESFTLIIEANITSNQTYLILDLTLTFNISNVTGTTQLNRISTLGKADIEGPLHIELLGAINYFEFPPTSTDIKGTVTAFLLLYSKPPIVLNPPYKRDSIYLRMNYSAPTTRTILDINRIGSKTKIFADPNGTDFQIRYQSVDFLFGLVQYDEYVPTFQMDPKPSQTGCIIEKPTELYNYNENLNTCHHYYYDRKNYSSYILNCNTSKNYIGLCENCAHGYYPNLLNKFLLPLN